ncbi:hypothetical protein KBI52_09945 [Microvirga sp. HBU67558]|uniref:hypothetical protein n=1 Tax=Microvirga TaxID=186650 RepID=UPI001B39326D|nr:MULTISPECIES: hypothetical protein [unclassified Microvirga]MBQ0820523.1 hypothetical protein [Microvirga sp. HBU67558]
MKKTLILLGATIVTNGMMFSGAEARLVRYEINGKQYSYSTNNIAQTAEARKRIAAAKAAEAAKAKAETEKARNPLAAAFGSTTQKEAKATEERLQQILSGPTEYMAVSPPAPDRTAEAARKPQEKLQEKLARPAPETRPAQKPVTVVRAPAKPVLASAVAASLVIAEPISPQRQTKVKSVSFDMQTGIKTTIMNDGTIEEEPFDSSALAVLAPEAGKMHSLTAFVNQLRRTAPEETTGSIQTSVADPDDGSLIRHR